MVAGRGGCAARNRPVTGPSRNAGSVAAPLLQGTFLLNGAGNVKHYAPGSDLFSVYFSDVTVNEFNVANKVYAAPVAIETVLDPSIVQAAAK